MKKNQGDTERVKKGLPVRNTGRRSERIRLHRGGGSKEQKVIEIENA